MYYNDYGTTFGNYDSAAAGFAAGLLVFIVFVIIIALAAVIVELIAKMKLFKKAGKPSWAAFVPGYNSVITCEMVGVDPRWVLIAIYGSVLNIVPIIGSLAYLAVAIYYAILVNVSLARAFGKSDGFAVGLILLPVVFLPILAFGNAKYGKTNPVNDFLFKKKAN